MLPADVVQLFIPVLGHRLVLRPVFLSETRDLTQIGALEQLRDLCLERVPPPRPDWDVSGSTSRDDRR